MGVHNNEQLTRKMLDAARRGAVALGPAAAAVAAFVCSRLNADGGFANRAGKSDLYYSLFGIQCLAVLDVPVDPAVRRFAALFGNGTALDFMHACCLARLWGLDALDALDSRALAARIEQSRCPDGGYSLVSPGAHGSVYGCFLAWLAYESLATLMPDRTRIAGCIAGLRSRDGAYANEPGLAAGTTTATAAALVLQACLGLPRDSRALEWLRSQFAPHGGFVATPGAPMADLLSTATALFALAHARSSLDGPELESCTAFLSSLHDECGGFRAVPFDETVDCEYTFYGLLATGSLPGLGSSLRSDNG